MTPLKGGIFLDQGSAMMLWKFVRALDLYLYFLDGTPHPVSVKCEKIVAASRSTTIPCN